MAIVTILAALKAQVQYPLPDMFFETVLVKRDLSGDEAYSIEVDGSVGFKGALADCYRQIVLFPSSITEGDVSISKSDIATLKDIANRLYSEIGEQPIEKKPRITFY